MTNRNRQPKGIESGGQFAAEVNPESTVLLVDERRSVTVRPEFVDLGIRAMGFTRNGFNGILTADDVANAPHLADDDDGWTYLQLDDEVVMVKSEHLLIPKMSSASEPAAPREASVADYQRHVDHLESEINDLYEEARGRKREPDANQLLALKNDLIHQYRELSLKQAKELDEAPARLQGLAKFAYAIDAAIDTLERWDGEDNDPDDVRRSLIETREEIFAAASPDLVKQWRDLEAMVRVMEDDVNFTPHDNDEYEMVRDAREAAFRKIYEEAFTS